MNFPIFSFIKASFHKFFTNFQGSDKLAPKSAFLIRIIDKY